MRPDGGRKGGRRIDGNGRARLDDLDLRILEILQADGRRASAAIAREVGLSAPAVLDRVRRLEREGVITGYRAELEHRLLGFGLTALVSITLEHHGEVEVSAFREAVLSSPHIVDCYYVTGSRDFLLRVIVRDVPGYRDFLMRELSTLPGVERVESSVVLEVFKSSAPLAVRRPAGD